MTFNKGIVYSKEYRYDWYEEERTDQFRLEGNKLVISKNEAQISDAIDPITQDSIVVNSPSNPLHQVYKRIPYLKEQIIGFQTGWKKIY